MNNPRVLLLALLLAVVARINGQFPPQTIVRTDIKGRILSPEEGCGYSKVANTRIVGGAPAKNGAWPWLALLGQILNSQIKFQCGGSLITSKHVLTAAHCVPKVDFARLGEYDTQTVTDGKHEDINFEKKIVHEQWSLFYMINDIALLKLVRDVTFNDRIVPICLPDGPILTKNFVGLNPFIAGWGRLAEFSDQKPNVCHQVQLPVIPNAKCKEGLGKYKDNISFSDIVLCAGFTDGGKDTCTGDSGGPMMLPEYRNGKFPYYQIGIVSWGLGCARANTPGIYTNVVKFVDWINEKILL